MSIPLTDRRDPPVVGRIGPNRSERAAPDRIARACGWNNCHRPQPPRPARPTRRRRATSRKHREERLPVSLGRVTRLGLASVALAVALGGCGREPIHSTGPDIPQPTPDRTVDAIVRGLVPPAVAGSPVITPPAALQTSQPAPQAANRSSAPQPQSTAPIRAAQPTGRPAPTAVPPTALPARTATGIPGRPTTRLGTTPTVAPPAPAAPTSGAGPAQAQPQAATATSAPPRTTQTARPR